MTNSHEDEAPIPSEPILSEEETLKQLRDDLTRPYRDEIDRLKQRMAAAKSLLLPLGNQVTPSVLTIREAIRIL